LIAVLVRLCVCRAVVVRLVGDNRLCGGFLVVLLFIDCVLVVELAASESFDMLLALFYIADKLVVVVVLKN
jgi:hypothetical protein